MEHRVLLTVGPGLGQLAAQDPGSLIEQAGGRVVVSYVKGNLGSPWHGAGALVAEPVPRVKSDHVERVLRQHLVDIGRGALIRTEATVDGRT
jgi:hypothetical protein